MATVMPKAPFHVDCVVGSSGSIIARNKFYTNHGPNMLTTFLQEAGLDYGNWVFRIQEPFRVSGKTPPIQVRRPVVNGVSLWLKPGDNGSGLKGVLLVTKDKNKTPEDVYKLLDEKLKQERAQTAESRCVDHIDLDVDDLTLVLLLEAVDEVVTEGRFQFMNTFVDKVARRMTKEDVDVSHWLEVLEHAVCLGLLKDEKTHYAVTQKGLEFVAHADDSEQDCRVSEEMEEPEETEEPDPEEVIVPVTPAPHANGNGHRSTTPAYKPSSHFGVSDQAAVDRVAAARAAIPRAVVQPPPPIPTVLPVVPSATPAVAAATPPAASDPVAILIANQKKFAEMSKTVDQLMTNRTNQAKAVKAIEDSKAELIRLQTAEKEITKGLDIAAMAAFFK